MLATLELRHDRRPRRGFGVSALVKAIGYLFSVTVRAAMRSHVPVDAAISDGLTRQIGWRSTPTMPRFWG